MDATLPVASRWLRRVCVAGYAVVVLSASVVDPGGDAASTLFGVNITVYAHVLAYALLAVAVGYARMAADRRTLVVAVAVATLYGGGIELLQGRLPYRTMSGFDAGVNAVGAVCGALLWRALAPWVVASEGTTPLSASTE